MLDLFAYIDGVCSGNGTPRACAASAVVLLALDRERVVRQRELVERCPGAQTNNRAELYALILALQTFSRSAQLTVVTDSAYVYGVLNLRWRRNNNLDLWVTADALCEPHSIRYEQVKGHGNNLYNNRADALAQGLARQLFEATAV